MFHNISSGSSPFTHSWCCKQDQGPRSPYQEVLHPLYASILLIPQGPVENACSAFHPFPFPLLSEVS